MKRIFRQTYLFLVLAAVTMVMAACASDNENDETPQQGQTVQVRLHLSTGLPTRARTVEWNDTNAQAEEMMNIWVVVITNNSDQVEKVIACKPTGTEREIDPIAQLPTGTHRFYSFANMSVAKVAELLGITITMPDMTNNDEAYEATTASGTVNADKEVQVDGNFFDTAALNGFGSTGIPMSNMQQFNISGSTSLDLVVIRLLAKMEISIKNETGAAATVKSLTLSDITSNGAANLKLLPSLTTGANSMAATHQDIRPNLKSGAATDDLTIDVSEKLANNATITKIFYVNESATPTGGSGLFYLTLKMSGTEYRYALLTDNDAHEWNYIARNDYRVIPIVLDDYKLELVPYDFPPIGVFPCSVREIDTDLYEMTFHDYGHFHLVPRVTKLSDNTQVQYGTTGDTRWTLMPATSEPAATAWQNTFLTAATKGGAWVNDGNPGGFYRSQTSAADGDDAGGVPVWYLNDGTAGPQWRPVDTDTESYQPFLYGYIADPGSSFTTDKQVYHEFRVQLYVNGAYRRDMLYRFYMTLSADQMLYAPHFNAPAAASHHALVHRQHNR